MRIEFSREHDQPWADADLSAERETLAIGTVTKVTEHRAKVRIGVNEDVPIGALASPTKDVETGSLTAPPRVGEVWQVELMARPFVAAGELGGGFFLSGELGYRFASEWRLRASVNPLAYAAVENRESVSAVSASVLGSYDSRFMNRFRHRCSDGQ